MASNIHSSLSIILSCLIWVASANNDLYDGVADGGQNDNPGIKLRITQNGLDYLNSILLYEMNKIIPRLHVDDMEHSSGGGHIRITNARVSNYKPPNSQSLKLSPPDQIIWSTSGMNIALKGHVRGSYGRISEQGDADVYANNVDFKIGIEPTRQGNGQFGAKTRSCDADVGGLDFNIYNTGMLGKMLQNNKGAIISRLRPRLGEQMCKAVTKMIDQAANGQLASIPTKVPLNSSANAMFNKMTSGHDHGNHGNNANTGNGRGKGKGNSNKSPNSHSNKQTKSSENFFDLPDGTGSHDRSSEVRRELTKNITKHLTFDYSNLKDPSVQSRYLETYNKGEISYHGQGGTPFSPADMHEDSVKTDRMVYALASDYVANSMLYNAHTHNLLKTRVSAEETPEFKSQLKTTCDDDGSAFDFCLGTIIPEMQESFPDSQAEINFETTRPPALLFHNGGIANLMGQGLITLIALKGGQRKTMAVANLDMVARAKLFIDDNKIKGNCTLDKYEVTMKENNLKGFDAKRLKDFTGSTKSMFEILVNAYLKNGLKLPTTKVAKLKNAKLNIYERTARIDTDIEADKEELTKMAVKVIQQHGGRVDGY